MNDYPALAVVIPTYREPEHIRALLADLARQQVPVATFVVNSNPDDETSQIIRAASDTMDVHEVVAKASDFWAGAVRKGMVAATRSERSLDGLLLLNTDIRLTDEFLRQAASDLGEQNALRCYAAVSHDRSVTSGVRMRSWVLSRTAHLPAGDPPHVPAEHPADMLAGRALLLPRKALESGALPASRFLPHYGADYEMTRRLGRRGFDLYVSTRAVVHSDVSNTGRKASAKDLRLSDRLRLLSDKRSPSNLLYRTRFVYSCYPSYAFIPGIATVILKGLLEVLLGRVIYRLFARHHLYE